ncbi:Gfo/Idh/MocA family protein [Salipaludibacillus daqingensis]|uniref:Gfo/Idh/MocA family protein n=1 Tax=Salipaludibacillus daqingensis TaxID=3041001 RepID=UPI002474F975|nr:Gfo/Idh/MocA family oxidoreductase [Salipaludibacillus daqingensis]
MVNLALIGAWHVHTEGFVEDALLTGVAKLKVVWDDDEARGKAFAKRFGVPFEKDLDTVLNDKEVDAVIVECATTTHTDIIIQCANAKKDIFSDKALALTVEDCKKIEAAVDKNHVTFAVSLESKVIGAYRYAKQLVDEGTIGKISAMYFRRAHQAALNKNMLPSYWFDASQTGGGATLDLGCHGLYLLPYFCGTPKKVTCLMNEIYGTGSDENSTTVIEFEDGAIGTAHTSFVASQLGNVFEIIGTEGTILIFGESDDNFKVWLQSKQLPGHEELTLIPREDVPDSEAMPSAQFVRFISSKEEGDLAEFDMNAAISLTRLIECAYESSREGKTVLYGTI